MQALDPFLAEEFAATRILPPADIRSDGLGDTYTDLESGVFDRAQ